MRNCRRSRASGCRSCTRTRSRRVRQAQIPLRICNAFEPEKPGTLVRPQVEPDGRADLLRGPQEACHAAPELPQEPDAETKLADVLEQARLSPFSMQSVCGELTALVPMEPGSERLHRLREQAAQALRPQACTLRENLSVLAALCRSTAAVPELLRAVETSGRAGPSAAKMRRLRPPARQRQPI